jgi:hypothetical protein
MHIVTHPYASYKIAGGASSSSAPRSRPGSTSRRFKHKRCKRPRSKARSFPSALITSLVPLKEASPGALQISYFIKMI